MANVPLISYLLLYNYIVKMAMKNITKLFRKNTVKKVEKHKILFVNVNWYDIIYVSKIVYFLEGFV